MPPKSKLLIVRSADRISGTTTAFRVDLGDRLACSGYSSCKVKYLDAAIETTGQTIKLTQLNSKDMLFVNARMGQSSVDTKGLDATIGYIKLAKANGSTGSTSGSTHQTRTPATCETECNIPRGLVDFSITTHDYGVLSTAGIANISIVIQLEYL